MVATVALAAIVPMDCADSTCAAVQRMTPSRAPVTNAATHQRYATST